jgi:hypothetical protein
MDKDSFAIINLMVCSNIYQGKDFELDTFIKESLNFMSSSESDHFVTSFNADNFDLDLHLESIY